MRTSLIFKNLVQHDLKFQIPCSNLTVSFITENTLFYDNTTILAHGFLSSSFIALVTLR